MQVRRAQSFNAGKETVPCRGHVAADEANLHPWERSHAGFSRFHNRGGEYFANEQDQKLPPQEPVIGAFGAGVCIHCLIHPQETIDLTLT